MSFPTPGTLSGARHPHAHRMSPHSQSFVNSSLDSRWGITQAHSPMRSNL